MPPLDQSVVPWINAAFEKAAILYAEGCVKTSTTNVEMWSRMIFGINIEAKAINAANQLFDEVETAIRPNAVSIAQ